MANRFGGVPVEEQITQPGNRFGGTPVGETVNRFGGAPVTRPQGVFQQTLGTLQGGLSDAMSSVMGDTYGRSGDVTQRDELPPANRLLKAAGGDVIPAMGEAGMNLMIEAGKAVLPPAAEEAVGTGLQRAVTAITESAPGQAVSRGLEAWRKDSPETYATAGEIANIATLGVPVKAPKFAKTMRRRGQLEARRARKAARDVESRMRPPRPEEQGYGKYVIADDAVGTKEFVPNRRWQGVIDEAEATPGFDVKNAHTANKEALVRKVDEVNTRLVNKLDDAAPITSQQLDDAMIEAMERAAKEPLLTGEAGTAASRMYEKFNDLYVDKLDDAGNISARDLLEVRREFDNFLEDAMKDPFSPGGTAAKVATREMRQTINDLVADAAPGAGVKDDLAQMNRLLEGRDVLIPKAEAEANRVFGRYIERLEETTGFKHPVSPMAAEQTARNPIVMGGAALAAGGYGGLGDKLRGASVIGDELVADALRRASTGAQRAAIISAINEDED